MDVLFHSEHMKTLSDLQAMAEKHNCIIKFGFRTSSTTEFCECEHLIEKNVPPEVITAIEKCDIQLNGLLATFDCMWFELYDIEKKKYNTMCYSENSVYFTAEEQYCWDDEPPEEVKDWLYDGCYEGGSYYVYNEAPTVINGFGYEGEHYDGRVYREGMALKFFADLVCEYLGEDYIQRTY